MGQQTLVGTADCGVDVSNVRESFPHHEDFDTPLHEQYKRYMRLRRLVNVRDFHCRCLGVGASLSGAVPVTHGLKLFYKSEDVRFVAMNDVPSGHFVDGRKHRPVVHVSTAVATLKYGVPVLKFDQNLSKSFDYQELPYDASSLAARENTYDPYGNFLDCDGQHILFALCNLIAEEKLQYAYWAKLRNGQWACPAYVQVREYLRKANDRDLNNMQLVRSDADFLFATQSYQAEPIKRCWPKAWLRFPLVTRFADDFLNQAFWQTTESTGNVDVLTCHRCRASHDVQVFGVHDRTDHTTAHNSLGVEWSAKTAATVSASDKMAVEMFREMFKRIAAEAEMVVVDPETRQKVGQSSSYEVIAEQIRTFKESWITEPFLPPAPEVRDVAIQLAMEVVKQMWPGIKQAYNHGTEFLESGGEFIAYAPCGCRGSARDGRMMWHMSDRRQGHLRRRFTNAHKIRFLDDVADGVPFFAPANCTLVRTNQEVMASDNRTPWPVTIHGFVTDCGMQFSITLPFLLSHKIGDKFTAGQLIARLSVPPDAKWRAQTLDNRWATLGEAFPGLSGTWVGFIQQQWFKNQAILLNGEILLPCELVAPAAKDLRPVGFVWDFSSLLSRMDEKRRVAVFPAIEMRSWDHFRHSMPFETNLDAGIYDPRFRIDLLEEKAKVLSAPRQQPVRRPQDPRYAVVKLRGEKKPAESAFKGANKLCPMCGGVFADLAKHINAEHDNAVLHPC
jgi:hypothetical protein